MFPVAPAEYRFLSANLEQLSIGEKMELWGSWVKRLGDDLFILKNQRGVYFDKDCAIIEIANQA